MKFSTLSKRTCSDERCLYLEDSKLGLSCTVGEVLESNGKHMFIIMFYTVYLVTSMSNRGVIPNL